jgi:hypothetical protein
VNYSAADFAHDKNDELVLFDLELDKVVATQKVGTKISGTKVFRFPRSSSYEVRYLMVKVGKYAIRSTSKLTAEIPPSWHYSLDAAPTTVIINEDIGVSYIVPIYMHSTKDKIFLVDATTGKRVASKVVTKEYAGSVTFTTRLLGDFYFEYQLGTLDQVVLMSSNSIRVTLPSSAGYSLRVSDTYIKKGTSVDVSYISPKLPHNKADQIALFDRNSGKRISAQNVGIDISGTKTFTIKSPGSYEFRYVLKVDGNPTIATSLPITVYDPNAPAPEIIEPDPIEAIPIIPVEEVLEEELIEEATSSADDYFSQFLDAYDSRGGEGRLDSLSGGSPGLMASPTEPLSSDQQDLSTTSEYDPANTDPTPNKGSKGLPIALIVIVFIADIAFFVGLKYLLGQFRTQLRVTHPDVHQVLSESGRSLADYVKSSEYKNLDDPALNSMGARLESVLNTGVLAIAGISIFVTAVAILLLVL